MHADYQIVEKLFRHLIDRELGQKFGPGYWKQVIPGDIRDKVRLRAESFLKKHPHVDPGRYTTTRSRLDFCDVPDYRKILSSKRTRELFRAYFPSAEGLAAKLVHFEEYRNARAHGRPLDEISLDLGRSASAALHAALHRALEGDLLPDDGEGAPSHDDTEAITPTGPADGREGDGEREPAPPAERATPTSRENRETSRAADRCIDPGLLPKELNKIWRKLAGLYDVSTPEDVQAVDPDRFAGQPGVGTIYVDGLADLKTYLSEHADELAASMALPATDESVNVGAKYYLNWIELGAEDRKALRKIRTVLDLKVRVTANQVLDLNLQEFGGRKGVGEGTLERIRALRRRIGVEANRLADQPELGIPDSALLVPADPRPLSMVEADELLTRDIDRFMRRGPPEDGQVLRRRWGLGCEGETLEQIGKGLRRTRERIRQLQDAAERRFRESLAVPPESLRLVVEQHLHSNLTELLPRLAADFSSEECFQDFLSVASSRPRRWIREAQRAREGRFALVDEYFAEHESPAPIADVLAFFQDQDGWSASQASHSLRDLATQGRLVMVAGGLVPRGMKKGAALAHVLLMHPEGLSWSDAARAVNAAGYSARHLSLERVDGEFTRSPHLYLAGRGFYRHLAHLALDKSRIPDILAELRGFLAGRPRQTSKVRDAQLRLWPSGDPDYYALRHVCTSYGEAYGIHGSFFSSADTISLHEEHETVTTADYVLTRVTESAAPMTREEVQRQLTTSSEGWAEFLLARLVDEDRIIEVTRGHYLDVPRSLKMLDNSRMIEALDVAMGISRQAPETAHDDLCDLVNETTGRSFTRKYVRRLLVEHRRRRGVA